MVAINTYWFSVITILFLVWLFLLKRYGDLKSLFFINYFFNFCVFYGPLMYFKLGFKSYSNVTSEHSLLVYYIINCLVATLNIIVYVLIKSLGARLFFANLRVIKYERIRHHFLLKASYLFILVFCAIYLITFRNYFPLISLLQEGELGERLDATGGIPMYITVSSMFMVFVPSAFFYFKQAINNKVLNVALFLFTIFCLSAGGNKGLVSFFLIFYVLFTTKGKVSTYLILIISLAVIYAVLKGITSLNQETLNYMLESPFRRLFAAQGSGYLARIHLMDLDKFFDTNLYSIKHQVYAFIYNAPLGSGSSPTHFTGDLIVNRGYLIALIIYFIYLIIFVSLINTTSYLYNTKEDAFILWNFFLIAFITTNSDITLANAIRFFFVLMNILMIAILTKITVKNATKDNQVLQGG